MKVEIKNRVLKIVHKLKKNEEYRLSEKDGISTVSVYNKPLWVVGITSMCKDGRHVLFLEWDNVCKWIVEKDIERLSRLYSPFYLFKTKEEIKEGLKIGHYCAISLVKLSTREIFEIQKTTSVDSNYATMPLRNPYRAWVLRITNKGNRKRPQFLKVIGKDNLKQEVSRAHLIALRRIYDVPKIKYKNLDNGRSVYLNRYQTLNY